MAGEDARFYRWETPFEAARFVILSVAQQPALWFCNADRRGFEDPEPLSTRDELVVKICELGTLDLWEIRFDRIAAVSFARGGAEEADSGAAHPTPGDGCRTWKALGTPLARRHRAFTDPVSYILGTQTQSLEVLTFGHEWQPGIARAGHARLSERPRHAHDAPAPGRAQTADGDPHTGASTLVQATASPGHVGDDDAIHGGTELWMQGGMRVLLW